MATRATSFSVGYGEDSSSITHQRQRFANADEKCFPLRVERCVPLFQGNVQRRLEKFRCLRPGVANEDVQRFELRFHRVKDLTDFVRACDVSPNDETFGCACANLLERLFCGSVASELAS